MCRLLDKLRQINYEALDIEEFLDKRDSASFDREWIRVYQAVEELKKGKNAADPGEIEEQAYRMVYEKCDYLCYWTRSIRYPYPSAVIFS